jgi:hypothetical protein
MASPGGNFRACGLGHPRPVPTNMYSSESTQGDDPGSPVFVMPGLGCCVLFSQCWLRLWLMLQSLHVPVVLWFKMASVIARNGCVNASLG